jgi:DNA mismatch endonuclease, patch repair protein
VDDVADSADRQSLSHPWPYPSRDISRLQELGWRVLIVWECALRGREKLTDEALSERLEEWICGEGASAQIDTQGIHLLA